MRAFRDTLKFLLYMSLSTCRGGQGTLRDANNRHMGEAVPVTVQTKFNKNESKKSVKKVLFDVDVLVDISLARMDVHGGNNIKIFMKKGSLDGHEENWQARDRIFKKSDEDQILLKRGETYSFYLKGKGMEVNTLNKKSTFDDDYFMENDLMTMTKCVASKSKFTKNSMNAVWTGELVVSQVLNTLPEPVSCSDPNLNCQQCLENGCGWVGSCLSSCNIIADVRCYDTGRNTDFQSAVNDSCEKYETDLSDSTLCYGKSSDCETCTGTLKSNDELCLWHGSFCGSEGNMAGPGSTTCEVTDKPSDDIFSDVCSDSSLSCQECVEKKCGWAGFCLPSCDMIADVSCYDTFQTGSSPLDVCAKAAEEREDRILCSTVTPENSCTACTQTTKANGEQCVWIEMPPFDSFCASEGGMFGPGITQCPFEGACPEAKFTESMTVCDKSYIPVLCNNGQCGYGNECEAKQAGFSMIDDCVLTKVKF